MKKIYLLSALLSTPAYANVVPSPEPVEVEKPPECVCVDGSPVEENKKLRQELSRLNVENRAFRILLKRAKILK